ncbi:hypothetical protein INT45_006266 [Circinella minor]|uniref:Uncharacterized protein n=1 Tax=Circinella minor TaxID=1195481 RepID=A0A8H7S1R3_9FUNG|nr:hypothetical protein INT45_006266 [Circinella minor]
MGKFLSHLVHLAHLAHPKFPNKGFIGTFGTFGTKVLIKKEKESKKKIVRAEGQNLLKLSRLLQVFGSATKNQEISEQQPPKDSLSTTIDQKRDEEYNRRKSTRKSIRCLRAKRIIDPIFYLPAFSRDKHRIIKWRMHWLPSYPLKNCRCGLPAAKREHYSICPILQPLLNKLLTVFGTIPSTSDELQPLDFIMNHLPRSEVGVTLERWPEVWSALIRVLREIDRLSHPDVAFDEAGPDPEDALDIAPPPHI